MLDKLNDEKIVFEIRELVNKFDLVKNEIDIYSDLVKQIFLRESLEN